MKKEKERIGPEVIEHWYQLVAGHQFSARDLYDVVQAEVEAQKVPGLEISRVDLSEGGVLSDKREYLRMKRERIVFDICAAPVGVNYFFSYRFYVLPAVVKIWEMAVAAALLVAIWWIFNRLMGPFLGPVILFGIGVGGWLMLDSIGICLRDIDAELIKSPVIGPIYERFFRKDTYYRQDIRIAYGTIVSIIVKEKVKKLTAVEGVRLLREYSYSPIFDGLYSSRDGIERPVQAEA